MSASFSGFGCDLGRTLSNYSLAGPRGLWASVFGERSPSSRSALLRRFATDLYATGMIAVQALSGLSLQQLPTDPTTGWFQIAANAQNAALLRFIERLTQPDPGDRFPHAAAALQALTQLASSFSVAKSSVNQLAQTALLPTRSPCFGKNN